MLIVKAENGIWWFRKEEDESFKEKFSLFTVVSPYCLKCRTAFEIPSITERKIASALLTCNGNHLLIELKIFVC